MTMKLEERPQVPGEGGVTVTQVGGHIGAVVEGLRIGADLDPAQVHDFRHALLTHKVVFLRGQDHATDHDQYDFAAQLGEVTSPHPTVKGDGKAVLPIDSEQGKANSWHTDVTFVDRIPAISVLRAVTLPPYGDTTVWANTVNAYQTLNPALKAMVGGLRAIHSNQYDYAGEHPQLGGIDVREERYRKEFAHLLFLTEHPLVRIHPETQEPSLLLGHFVRSITGLSTFDSQDLFQLLQRHITRLENTARWSWQPGDIAIWDNRATQHYAVADYDDHPRRLHRITVAGDVPVGIAGDTSRVIQGDASAYSSVGGLTPPELTHTRQRPARTTRPGAVASAVRRARRDHAVTHRWLRRSLCDRLETTRTGPARARLGGCAWVPRSRPPAWRSCWRPRRRPAPARRYPARRRDSR